MAISTIDDNTTKISKVKVGANIVLAPKKSLIHKNCEELEALFDELIGQNRIRIILDFKTVPFIDSMTLELLIKCHDELKNRGGALKLIALNSVCRDILLVTRLINIFNVYEDINEALRS